MSSSSSSSPSAPRPPSLRAEPRTTLVVVVLVVAALLRGACAGVMGEQCDWTGSGVVTAGRGVTPVYLRCSAGALSWRWPRGALRVLLRVGASGREFRGCVRTRGAGARLFLEGPRSLAPLYPSPGRRLGSANAAAAGEEGGAAAPVPVRCFYSRRGQAALYVEASELGAPGVGEPPQEFGLEYDLEPLPRGAKFDDSQECRPCTSDEMARAYCTSDLVARGYIRGVENDEDLEESRVEVKLTRVLRRLAEVGAVGAADSSLDANEIEAGLDEEDEAVWVENEAATLRMPLHCGAKHGPGEFVFMARRKLGQLALTCAARLDEWVQVVSDVNAQGSAHCVLRS